MPNADLARRLPRNLAHRFHALPVGEERGVLTVVMADPDDQAARQAVSTALGTAPFVVRGDRQVIDTLISDLWAEQPAVSTRYLVHAPADHETAGLCAYARQLAELTGAQLDCVDEPDIGAVVEVAQTISSDLVICRYACEPLARRIFCSPADAKLAQSLSTSLLVVAGFRWPLAKILMVILDPDSNEASLAWVRALAQPAGATVTALAVVPPVPDLYSNLPGMKHDIAQLLATGTPLGREMRRVAGLLVDWKIEGFLRLRQGPVTREIRLEAWEGDYDVIVLCAESRHRLLDLVLGGWVDPLLRWADRPVLIAKSPPAARAGGRQPDPRGERTGKAGDL
jgi:nucleotide-binding universal stress UspA family protein